MIPDRAPTQTWCLRRDKLKPFVSTAPNDLIEIYNGVVNGHEQLIELTRRDARLLAKRINQCLDATVKR